MTQLGEGVDVAVLSIDKHKDDTCPFCAEDPPADGQNKLDNSSSTLRTACHSGDCLGMAEPGAGAPGSPQWSVVYTHPTTGQQEISAVRNNPHHCIPGRASLKGHFQHPILEAIEKSKGTITADIGYDVNGRKNGVWLPTIIEHFYAGYSNVDPVAGISWGRLTRQYPMQQFSMAEAAMYEARRQFHDAHPDYSDHVKGRLDKLMDKLVSRKMSCPEAGPKAKPNVPPPYALVQWLDALSHTMASHLSNDPKRWKDPIFTSRHARAFHDKLV
jgi:A nuclease family of the HNH/ENDO VII superfamily with conserved AHH